MTADTVQFLSAMEKAAYLAQKNMNKMQRDASLAGKVIGGALAAGATAFAYSMKKFVDDADNLGKAAQRLGVTTEELSKLRYAADLSGISFEQLEANINKLNRAANDQNKVFTEMGISLRDSAGGLKSADELLGDVAEKFAAYEDGAMKSAVAQELFGKSGAAMIPLLNEGRDGLEEMKDEAAKLGIVITSKTAKSAEVLNDNITRLNKSISGAFMTLISDSIPVLADFSDQLVASKESTNGLNDASKFLAETLLGLMTVGKFVGATFEVLGQNVKNISAGFILVARGDFKALKELYASGSKEASDAFAKAMEESEALFQKHFNRLNGIEEDYKSQKKASSAFSEEMIMEGRRLAESLQTPLEILTEQQKRYNELLEAGAISQETFGRAIIKANEDFQDQQKQIKNVDSVMKDMGATFTSAFEDAILDGKKFSDVLRGLEKDILRIVLRKKVLDPLLNAVLGSFGGGGLSFGGVTSPGTSLASQLAGFGVTGIASAKGNIFSMGNVVPFADGGVIGSKISFPLAGGKTGIAGESGPEAIIPLTRTRGGELGIKSAGNGGGVQVNIYAPPGSKVSEDRQSEGGMERINVYIDEATAGNLSRPGSKTFKAMRKNFGLDQKLIPR